VSDADRASYDHEVAAVRRALGEPLFTAAWLTGTTRDVEELVVDLPRIGLEDQQPVGGQ